MRGDIGEGESEVEREREWGGEGEGKEKGNCELATHCIDVLSQPFKSLTKTLLLAVTKALIRCVIVLFWQLLIKSICLVSPRT